MAGNVGTIVPFSGFDPNNEPLIGGLLTIMLAGTDTKTPAYADATLLTPLTNPIVLDSCGRCLFYLDPAKSYKYLLTDSNGVTQDLFPVDNIQPLNATSITLGQVQEMGGDPNTSIQAVAYPSGATYDKCHGGTAWWVVDAGALPGTYVLQGMELSIGGGQVTVGLFNLTDNPNVAIAEINSVSITGALVASPMIVFPAAGAAKTYGIKAKVASGSGCGWALSIVRTS